MSGGAEADPRSGGEGPAPPPLSGFSIAKNVSVLDYPVEAALRSALPLCDELVVNVGLSEDDTLERVEALAEEDGRIRVLRRDWGPERGRTTRIHSEETNRALDACRNDWALYVQADEVLHEEDFTAIGRSLARAARHERAEGLLFDYLHFYGSPEWLLTGRRAYRAEVRIVRRSSGVRSAGGAQGFRVDGRVPRVLRSGARVFHYGYVKSREALREKRRLWARYEGRDDAEVPPFRFRRFSGLEPYRGDHPPAIREWLRSREWPFDPEEAAPPPGRLEALRVRISDAIERLTGHRLFEHRNYEVLE